MTVLVFLGSLLMLIGIHEAGHFLAAKAFGVYVIEFAFGFGPQLVSHKGKETRYSIRLVPFGGYVRMAGEDRRDEGTDIPEERRLYSKPAMVRAAISLAGPAMNLILSILITIVVMWSYSFPVFQVAALVPDGPSVEILQPGDRILAIDGHDVYLYEHITDAIQASVGDSLDFSVRRENGIELVKVQPEYVEEEERYVVGVYFETVAYTTEIVGLDPVSTLGRGGLRDGDVIVSLNGMPIADPIHLLLALAERRGPVTVTAQRGAEQIDAWAADSETLAEELSETVPFADLGVTTRHAGLANGVVLGAGQFAGYVTALADAFGGIVTGRLSVSETIQGPVGIARTLGEGLRIGPEYFFMLLAFLSTNFGLLNLFPIPGLDGSRIAFALYERIRGRPIPVEREGMIHAIGFIVLIAVMILITFKDLVSLFR